MNVLHVQTGDGLTGGVARYVSKLCSAAVKGNYQCAVACSDPSSPKAVELYGNCPLYKAKETYGLPQLAMCVRDVVQAARQTDAAVLHAHALRAGLMCAVAKATIRIPLVYTNHGLRFTQKTNILSRALFYCLEALVAACCDRVVCIRKTDWESLRRVMPWLKSKAELVTTRIDSEPERARTLPPQPFLLLGVGSLLPVKNPELFVRWVESVSRAGVNVRAKWLGDGPLRDLCERLTKHKGLPVQWCGNLATDEVDREMREATLLLLTSDYETAPLVVLEAMSAGLPVVAKDIRGISDTISHKETGLVVPDRDEKEAVDSIVSVLGDPALWTKLSEGAGKAYEKQFRGSDKMGGQYASIYYRLVGRCKQQQQ